MSFTSESKSILIGFSTMPSMLISHGLIGRRPA